MNKSLTYSDLNNLTTWIDNQRAFEKHKSKLDTIYFKLNKKSMNEFGFNNKAYEHLQYKIKNLQDLHKFNLKEQSLVVNKLNTQLGQKINVIQKRQNLLIKNQVDNTDKNKILRKRISIIKKMEIDKINRENEMISKRIFEMPPCLNFKKYCDEYQKTSNYKKFNKKFDLPAIKVTGFNIVKRKLDISSYDRAQRINTFYNNFQMDEYASTTNNDENNVILKIFKEMKKSFIN